MSKGADNPFQSPPAIPELVPSPSRTRRIAGIFAYVLAGYLAILGLMQMLLLFAAMLLPARDLGYQPEPLTTIFITSSAVLLGWAGYRLRNRARGKPEWIVFAVFLAIILSSIVLFLTLSMWMPARHVGGAKGQSS